MKLLFFYFKEKIYFFLERSLFFHFFRFNLKRFLWNKILKKKGSKGQIVVEYVLLLLISIGLASLIVSQMVSRDPNNPGFLISKWYDYLRFIASDLPEEIPTP